MSVASGVTLRVVHRFTAPPERVFDAWLDPRRVGRWLFATPTGTMVPVEIDARIGGRFTIVERRDGEDVAHTGTYLEIDRPRRLVFTLAVQKYGQATDRISVDIVAADTGCVLTLTHENLPADLADRAEAGWAGVLAALAATLVER